MERNSGFSTIEVLVAMAILAIVTSQILGVVGIQQRAFATHEQVLEVQEDSRLVTDLMLTDLRMAGFMVPNMIGVSSVDGGGGGPDRLCVSDASTIDVGSLGEMSWRYQGAKLGSSMSGATGSMTIDSSSLDIDGDTTVDFAVDSGLIISDGTRSHCARIVTLNSGSGAVTFTPNTPSGWTASTTDTRIAPAIIYEVTSNGLERNKEVFSPLIEDLQVEFSVDGAWVNSLNGSDPGDVDSVRLNVVTRTDRDDLDTISGQRPAVANRSAGPADSYRRRQVTSIVAPRNFM